MAKKSGCTRWALESGKCTTLQTYSTPREPIQDFSAINRLLVLRDNLLALSALRLNRTFIVFRLVLLLKIGSACPAMPAAALDSVTLQSSKTLEPGHVFVPDLTDALLVCAKVKESGMQL